MTTLEQIIATEDQNETQVTAVCSLLNMGIRNVPDGILKSTFTDVSPKLLHILKEYSESGNNVLIKSIFGILTVFLRAQDLGIWSSSNTQQIFSAILNPYTLHNKPKVTKLYYCYYHIYCAFFVCSGENLHNYLWLQY